MRFAYAGSFHAAIRRLSRVQGKRLLRAAARFEAAWQQRRFPPGLGVTHLRKEFFEFRVDARTRVLYQRQGGTVLYLLYGNHEDIRRFLKSV